MVIYPLNKKLCPSVFFRVGILSSSLYKEGTNVFENHPKLETLRKENPQLSSLFRPYEKFGRQDIEDRINFLRVLARIIWDGGRILEYTDFDNFEDLEGYAYAEDFNDEIEIIHESKREDIKDKKKKASSKIKSSAPGETVKIRAHAANKGVYDTRIRVEANHEGKVRIYEIIGLINRPMNTPMPHAEKLREDMIASPHRTHSRSGTGSL